MKESFMGPEDPHGKRSSVFLSNLKRVFEEAPLLDTDRFQSVLIRDDYAIILSEFQVWHAKLRKVFIQELEAQFRTEEEIKVFSDAFDQYNLLIEDMRTLRFTKRFERLPDDQVLKEVKRELLSLKHDMGEVVFAATLRDLLCVSCETPQFLAKLLRISQDDPRFKRFLKGFFSSPEDQALLKGEIDAATLSPDGKLRVFEFKFHSPVFADHRYTNANINPLIADRYALQLFKLSRILSKLRTGSRALEKYGLSLALDKNPELIFAPLTRYDIDINIRNFIRRSANVEAPQNVDLWHWAVFDDTEVEAVFSQLLDRS